MDPKLARLAPGLLIASPPLGDPNFDRAVILLASHTEEGALGFVVNRVAPVGLGALFGLAGYADMNDQDTTPVYLAGPVQRDSGWVVSREPFSPEEEGSLELDGRLWISSSKHALDSLAADVKSGRYRADRCVVTLGYSGWGPGQLEREIGAGAWLPAPFDPAILFEGSVESRWERAHALLGIMPVGGISMRMVGQA